MVARAMKPSTRIAVGIVAATGLAASSPFGATANAQTDTVDAALGSVTSGSVGIGGAIGSGEATGSLPGQCTAVDPTFGSLGIGQRNYTTAVSGEQPGHTAFLVDQNLPSEGSTKTEDPVINWKNEDTGETGTVTQYPLPGHIHWFEFQGEDVWGADIETGPGRITWTFDAHETGIFIPGLSVEMITGGLVPPPVLPYTGCGGEVVVP
ncbi:Hypothetical protein BJL86_2645 [Dietzia timorensis]|uniref:Uncharacterized protein n=2 Tax=Dietzia timorensis TaxID=499555 RepID=A0A173LMA2_9ACTN|nr:Hypothetical protein BJL86_2645 [Dietzia timorensis]